MVFSTSAIEPLIFVGAFLVLMSILASRISARLGVPALLLFLFVGMLAGSEGIGGIHFDDPKLTQSIGVFALAIILFSGGLDTSWRSVRPVIWQGLSLSTFGVFATAVLVGYFVSLITPFTFTEGLLLGSIVSSTDAAAVFSVLRSKNIRLKGNLKPLLELESGSNDPMAVFLTVAVIGILKNPDTSFYSFIGSFFLQMILGAVLGYLAGRLIVYVINYINLEYEGLYTVLSLALLMITYSGVSLAGGNGYLAVYIAGIIMGNRDFIHKQSLKRFHDGLAWLMQITMFLTLGLLVFPSHILPVIVTGLLTAAFLTLVARPVSVFLGLAFAKVDIKDKTLISWVGLRGAVPIILATFPLLAGIEQADMIFNIVFFIVLTSALLQGTTIARMAKWLGVEAPPLEKAVDPYTIGEDECMICKLNEIRVPEGSRIVGKQIVEIGLPDEIDVILINRAGRMFTPTGATLLSAGDILLVLSDEASLSDFMDTIQISR